MGAFTAYCPKIQGGIKTKMTKCPAFYAFNKQGKLIAVPCGLWTCKRCAKHLARMWSWRAKIQVQQAQEPYYFWTLTLRGKYHTPEQAFKALPRLWDTFRKIIQRLLKRKKDEKWSYLAFVEGQPKRQYMPHFHILSSHKSPKRLKDLAMQAGFGYQAKEVRLNSLQAAAYVAKYASKQSDRTPKKFRRVRASRDWAKLPEYEGEPLLVKAKDETLFAYLWRVHEETGVELDTLNDRWSLQFVDI